MPKVDLRCGDALALMREMESGSVQTCVTSPPYWGLRDYGVAGQLGLERTPQEYVASMVEVFREVRRVLRDDGTLWLNLGDSYCGYWGDKKALAEGRPSAADTNGWTNGFNMNAKPKYATLRDTGIKPKDLIGIPWRVAFALQADGWWLRSDIIWAKPNPMPESVTDRPTKSHEYLFLLTKAARYYYDAKAIAEPSVTDDPRRPYGSPGANALDPRGEQGNGKLRAPANRKRGEFNGKTEAMPGREAFRKFTELRNARSVWTIATAPYPEAHFATFPPELPRRCILAGSKEGDTVLDPFAGAGTTGLVADRLGRNFIGLELNPAYVALARRRIAADCPLFNEVNHAEAEE
jgi:DNA modification methylase